MSKERVLNTFADLCQIPSQSLNEKETARYCIKRLLSMGLDVDEDEAKSSINGNQSNVIARLHGNVPDVEPLLLNSHLDTVSPGGTIEPVIKGDRFVSKGHTILGADNRVGITMILEGLREVITRNLPHGPVEIVFTVAEEIGLLGAANLDYLKIQSKSGFALDSSGLGKIVQGAPYYNSIDIKIKGRSSHAAVNPELGINSVKLAADALSRLNFGKIDSLTTTNVGYICGGVDRNVVPSNCFVKMEVRSHQLENLDRETEMILNQFKSLESQNNVTVGDHVFSPEVNIQTERECDGFFLQKNTPVIETAHQALKAIGKEPCCYRNMGGSDANIFNAHGLQIAVIGTGQMMVHSPEEYVEIKDLISGVQLVPELITAWNARRRQK